MRLHVPAQPVQAFSKDLECALQCIYTAMCFHKICTDEQFEPQSIKTSLFLYASVYSWPGEFAYLLMTSGHNYYFIRRVLPKLIKHTCRNLAYFSFPVGHFKLTSDPTGAFRDNRRTLRCCLRSVWQGDNRYKVSAGRSAIIHGIKCKRKRIQNKHDSKAYPA